MQQQSAHDLFENRKCPEFLCHIKFKNSLPEPAIDSKLIITSPDLSRFAPYRVSSIEQEHEFEVPMNVMRLQMLDTVDLERFKPGTNECLEMEDEPLVKAVGGREKDSGRESSLGKGQRTEVSWLRRTEYLSTEAKNKTFASMISSPAKREKTKLETKDDVIRAIEDSFGIKPEKETLRHPTKTQVKAVAIYPIIPSDLTPEAYAQCTFDADPFVSSVDGIKILREGDQRAMVKAMSSVDDHNDTFIWYYLPSEEEKDKFIYSREYDIQRADRQGQSYFVLSIPTEPVAAVDSDDTVIYTPISGNFNLKKRRTKADHARQPHSLKVIRIA